MGLTGYSPRGHKELDMTEQLTVPFPPSVMGKSGPVSCFGSQLPAYISLCAGIQSRGTQNRPGLPRGLPCHDTGREGCRPGGAKAGSD